MNLKKKDSTYINELKAKSACGNNMGNGKRKFNFQAGPKGIIFIIFCILLLGAYLFFSTTLVHKTLFSENFQTAQENRLPDGRSIAGSGNGIAIPVSLNPQLNDYLSIRLKASNENSADFTSGTIIARWLFEGQEEYETINQHAADIAIDGIMHNYYFPLGENKYWPGNDPAKQLSGIKISLPSAEGIEVELDRVSLNRRIGFPLDTFVNLKLKEFFGINFLAINRFLVPAYVLILAALAALLVFMLLFGKPGSKSAVAFAGRSAAVFCLAVMIAFSVGYAARAASTVKSHFDANKGQILAGNLGQTYLGFYNFRKFISWLSSKIPEDENIILLVRGEPVYIISEMAYNLYPVDVKYIDISGKKELDIVSMIKSINRDNNNKYAYIVALSAEDSMSSKDLVLEEKFKEEGGFVYRLQAGPR